MISFRAYTDEWANKMHFFVRVLIFETRKEMQKDIVSSGFGPHNDCHGQCSGHAHYNKSGRLTGCMATIWFNKKDLNRNPAELISHECVHAAMRRVANAKLNLGEIANEEVLAYTVGSLTRQINNRLFKLGVLT